MGCSGLQPVTGCDAGLCPPPVAFYSQKAPETRFSGRQPAVVHSPSSLFSSRQTRTLVVMPHMIPGTPSQLPAMPHGCEAEHLVTYGMENPNSSHRSSYLAHLLAGLQGRGGPGILQGGLRAGDHNLGEGGVWCGHLQVVVPGVARRQRPLPEQRACSGRMAASISSVMCAQESGAGWRNRQCAIMLARVMLPAVLQEGEETLSCSHFTA